MPHVLSAGAAASKATRDLIIITLPVSGSEPEAIIRLSTGSLPAIEGETYDPKLRAMPQITYSDGGDADGGEFLISNKSNVYGQAFLNTDRALDGAWVQVIRAYKLADGSWEIRNPATSELYEHGQGSLQVEPIDEDTVKCMFTSDMSDAGLEVGGEPITQDCNKLFNFGGNHPLGGPCGWKVSMGGDPNFCDYIFDSATGCKGHNNQARFGGIQPLTPNAEAAASGGGAPIVPIGGYGDGSMPSRRHPDWDVDNRLPLTWTGIE